MKKFLNHCPVCSRKLKWFIEGQYKVCPKMRHFAMSWQTENRLVVDWPQFELNDEEMTFTNLERLIKLQSFK